jgi:hypothetical protein
MKNKILLFLLCITILGMSSSYPRVFGAKIQPKKSVITAARLPDPILTVSPASLSLRPGQTGTFTFTASVPPGTSDTKPGTLTWSGTGTTSVSVTVTVSEADATSVAFSWPQPNNCTPVSGTVTNAAGVTTNLVVPAAGGTWNATIGTISAGQSAQVKITVSG